VAAVTAPPEQKEFSSSMRVDAFLSDWRAALDPALPSEAKERALYEQAWAAYLEGDYGFGLWCWHECDRLANAFNGSLREVTRVLGPGHYLGFSHRKALASAIPLDRVHRPRKGEMSTPRPDAIVLQHYQMLCALLAQSREGKPKVQALLDISLGELDDRRRADPFIKYFETFRELLTRPAGAEPPPAAAAPPVAPTAAKSRKKRA
jgi:hypothetical protein